MEQDAGASKYDDRALWATNGLPKRPYHKIFPVFPLYSSQCCDYFYVSMVTSCDWATLVDEITGACSIH
jgi:hypothetical protein